MYLDHWGDPALLLLPLSREKREPSLGLGVGDVGVHRTLGRLEQVHALDTGAAAFGGNIRSRISQLVTQCCSSYPMTPPSVASIPLLTSDPEVDLNRFLSIPPPFFPPAEVVRSRLWPRVPLNMEPKRPPPPLV